MNEWILIVLVRGGLRYMKLTGGGGEQYIEPENDVPYCICSLSIARSLKSLGQRNHVGFTVTTLGGPDLANPGLLR